MYSRSQKGVKVKQLYIIFVQNVGAMALKRALIVSVLLAKTFISLKSSALKEIKKR
jgi:hypothetical protein